MERENAWKKYTDEQLEQLEALSCRYRSFISENKTERECVATAQAKAEAAGYVSLDDFAAKGRALEAGEGPHPLQHRHRSDVKGPQHPWCPRRLATP